MNELGIIAIALAAGAFCVLLLLGLAVLLWVAFENRKQATAFAGIQNDLRAEMRGVLEKSQSEMLKASTEHAARLRAELESAKSALGKTQAQVAAAWEKIEKDLSATLESHRKEMREEIEKINAEALQAAAVRSIHAVRELEKVVTLLQKLMLEAGEKPGSEYGPEEYATEDNPTFGTPPTGFSVSPVTRLDEEAQQEEERATEAQPI